MDIKGVCVFLATAAAGLLGFAALFLFAMNKVSESQGGGLAEGKFIGCVLGAIGSAAAAVYIQTVNLTYTG